MPRGSGGKKLSWPMWLAKRPLKEIQDFVCAKTGDRHPSVKGWIEDWERRKQKEWKPIIK